VSVSTCGGLIHGGGANIRGGAYSRRFTVYVALASVFRCLYLFFRSLVGEKYISGLALLKYTEANSLYFTVLVSIGWIFKLFG
jgi:hypothetical protein